MEREQILKAIKELPEIPVGKYPIEDHEIFEGNKYGGHFKFTQNFIQTPRGKISFYTLSVSGILGESRAKIIEDFTQVLGEPDQLIYDKSMGPHFVAWLIPTL